MSTLASRTSDQGRQSDAGLMRPALRTERTIALIRICVLAVVVTLFLGSIVIRSESGLAATVLLILSGIYAFACLLISVSDEGSSSRVRVTTLLIDVGLITLWVQATGGAPSEFWTLYLIVIVATGMRFGMLETIAVSIALAMLHGWVVLRTDGLGTTQLYRPTLLIVAGFAVGILSLQRTEQRRRRHEVEAIAESRGRQLGKERAEVERLRKVDLARTEFVGVAAHELRTPLAAILGVLGMLKDHGPAIEDRVRVDLIEGAEAQAERLSRLVEDLLSLSRIEDGVLGISTAAIEVSDLAAEALQASGTVGRTELELGDVDPVVCDADAVIRVLTNLLHNARKYSPEDGPIVLRVSQDEERVTFEVRDAGPGVPPQEREAVFERFRRADRSGKPGAGLGLYISRRLVGAHRGELSVGDAPEGGAAFSFWLPRRVPTADAEGVDDGRPM
jgi:signal transduction histidine kinase